MKLAIMQPYFCPYIGYFQLMSAVDILVIYDNIQYTKKGWINRNRILMNGKDESFSLPIKKDSDYLNINQRFLSDDFLKDTKKTLNKINSLYVKAPFFKEVYPLIENIFNSDSNNLFDFVFNSILSWKNYLEIDVKIVKSSEIGIDIEKFKGEEKVLKICKYLNSDIYINAIGGIELYSADNFKENSIELFFIKSKEIKYDQFGSEFVPWLSILDVAMFNDKNTIKEMVNQYSLIR